MYSRRSPLHADAVHSKIQGAGMHPLATCILNNRTEALWCITILSEHGTVFFVNFSLHRITQHMQLLNQRIGLAYYFQYCSFLKSNNKPFHKTLLMIYRNWSRLLSGKGLGWQATVDIVENHNFPKKTMIFTSTMLIGCIGCHEALKYSVFCYIHV